MSGFPFRGRGDVTGRSRGRFVDLSVFEARPSWGSALSWGFRYVGYARIRLLRPSSSFGPGRVHRRLVPAPPAIGTIRVRSFRDPEVFPVVSAASDGRSDRVPLQSCSLFRDCSRVRRRETPFATVSLRVLVPSTVPVRTACLRAATPWAPASAGFGDPPDALVSAANLPGVSHPGPSMGFPPFRAFSFVRIAFASRRTPPLVPLGTHWSRAPCVLRLQGLRMKAFTRRGLLHRHREAALMGVFASPGFST